jgi:hypothetical protein
MPTTRLGTPLTDPLNFTMVGTAVGDAALGAA